MVRPRSGPPDGRPAASLSAAPRSGAELSYRAPATPHSFLFAQIVSTAAAAASSLPPRLATGAGSYSRDAELDGDNGYERTIGQILWNV